MSIRQNYEKLQERIKQTCKNVGRNPASVEVIAISKTVPAERIREALACGIKIIGENRVQEAKRKFAIVGIQAEWHMVGHLQTNKVKDALKIFSLIHSLDSLHLAQKIEERASDAVDCLIEVNTSGEMTKYGIAPDTCADFLDALQQFKKINVRGLMTIGPGWAIEDPEVSRPCFRLLRDLRDAIKQKSRTELPILSMGMTSDFEVGIEEGATMIRVGTALFGPRA